ncbi:DUF4393 domain-containing protein [Pantoea agglomerans]|uniref:DUF4393 domain-containing protein n=1 Tax=Enterobacter agglomerans TaxID=549 RepID=A0A7X2SVF7_ENTAG|nr:DUF4393 domain-containing protein [Pantoea agglomerans]
MTKELKETLKAIPPEVIVSTYNDGVKGPLVQMGIFGEQILKTLRYFTYPIQAAAHRQDLIDRRFAEALAVVPESRRITPNDPLILEVADKLKFQINDNLVSDMYIDLLSASMDAEKANLAHPSFIHLISQISSDEAFLLLKISELKCSSYMRRMADWGVVTKQEREKIYSSAYYTLNGVAYNLIDTLLKPEEMHFPQNFYMYIEHLRALELIEYSGGDLEVPSEWRQGKDSLYSFWLISFSKFGQLFFECCSRSLNKLS